MRRRPVSDEVLGERLNALVATFDLSTIEPDPLQLVRQYDNPLDQEIAGLLAAAFAYGRADIVVRNVGDVLERMAPSPYLYLRSFQAGEGRRRFRGFAHRFHKTADLVTLLQRISSVLRRHGSLGALFGECYRADDPDIGPSLERFVTALWSGGLQPADRAAKPRFGVRRLAAAFARLPRKRSQATARQGASRSQSPGGGNRARTADAPTPSLRYLLTSPADGSACKRMNLYLRWMVRRTAPDLGLWTFVDPAKLVMPLDTHVHRITSFLGLGSRRTADWKAARALTDRLARFDPSDPVRFDFAICRLGILDLCSRRRQKANCDVCLLRPACRFPVV